jgi:pyruvate-ferredoxin/flavodoxin oxidoreductase
MTEQEIRELPKMWVVGGDGALGDIGFQNVSKVVLQNRPNVKILMLDTQVYSNTGGQNSDSSTMLGGYDMNQFGTASQGKLIEKKNVAEAFTSGHGSPFVAQVSMANAAKLYKAMLDGLEYRGTAFFQAYTTCQPEHGVGDNMSADQAKMVRDARGMPEFVFNPRRGESSQEMLDLKGNPSVGRDWWRTKYASTGEEYNFSVAHWALTEGRFRKHVKAIKEEEAAKLTPLDDLLLFITQDDVIHRRVFDPQHRSFVPNFGAYIKVETGGKFKFYAVTRQMVLFAVERRKAWRMLQSKAGVVNKDYAAQKTFLAKLDKGDLPLTDAKSRVKELIAAELAAVK